VTLEELELELDKLDELEVTELEELDVAELGELELELNEDEELDVAELEELDVALLELLLDVALLELLLDVAELDELELEEELDVAELDELELDVAELEELDVALEELELELVALDELEEELDVAELELELEVTELELELELDSPKSMFAFPPPSVHVPSLASISTPPLASQLVNVTPVTLLLVVQLRYHAPEPTRLCPSASSLLQAIVDPARSETMNPLAKSTVPETVRVWPFKSRSPSVPVNVGVLTFPVSVSVPADISTMMASTLNPLKSTSLFAVPSKAMVPVPSVQATVPACSSTRTSPWKTKPGLLELSRVRLPPALVFSSSKSPVIV